MGTLGALAVAAQLAAEMHHIEDMFKAGKGTPELEEKYLNFAKKREKILDDYPGAAGIAALVSATRNRMENV